MKIFDDKYIILTGGAGFIGSAVLEELNNLNIDNIIVVDDLGCDERWKNLVKKRFIDFVHKDDLFDWLQGREDDIEAFIHLGACSSTVEKDADYLMENNTHFSMELAQYALENEHRFIYASSAATYGDGKLGFSDAHEQLGQFAPLNMYGYSKHLFDLWLQREKLLDKVTGLKFFNVFGPGELHKGRMASAVVKMTADVQAKGEISLFKSNDPANFADGEQVRDFIYVKDVTKMIVQFLQKDLFGIYNVGRGEGSTWNQLANAVFKALDVAPKIKYIDMPEDLIGKYQNYTVADMKKSIRANLHMPTYSLDEGVRDYVRGHLLDQKSLLACV